ncbi:MAG: hypothetical protein EOP87_23440 [Verrucomicrobiaceae bacterium]|nr:MAG: hypothetical protein EOP87_23440 [Verrucomicrobiaceae bacterium]
MKVPQQRAAGWAGWIVPSVLLVLMPKCPACFAAYVALGSGIGLSLPMASAARVTLIVLCVAALVYLAGRTIGRRLAAKRHGRVDLQSNRVDRRPTLL